jgi:hypothetical protein
MINSEEAEIEFDKFFWQIGYIRVSEDVGSSPDFKNADYVHKLDHITVELKILEKERFTEGGVIDSLNAIIVQPQTINAQGYGQYSFTIPEINRHGRHDNFEEPLRQILKKANKQLKETMSFYCNDNSFTGYVVLAQTGLLSLSPEITALLVKRILDTEFNSIDGAIICVPYSNLINPITRRTNPVCVSVTKDFDMNRRNQCIRIADAWCKFLQEGGHSRPIVDG